MDGEKKQQKQNKRHREWLCCLIAVVDKMFNLKEEVFFGKTSQNGTKRSDETPQL